MKKQAGGLPIEVGEHVLLQLEQGVAASRAAFMVIIETGNRATSANTSTECGKCNQ